MGAEFPLSNCIQIQRIRWRIVHRPRPIQETADTGSENSDFASCGQTSLRRKEIPRKGGLPPSSVFALSPTRSGGVSERAIPRAQERFLCPAGAGDEEGRGVGDIAFHGLAWRFAAALRPHPWQHSGVMRTLRTKQKRPNLARSGQPRWHFQRRSGPPAFGHLLIAETKTSLPFSEISRFNNVRMGQTGGPSALLNVD